MRRSSRAAKELRLKIIEATKDGMTYEEIRRKYHVSPNTISKLVKGKSLNRYCAKCGETDPAKLEQHHPDKVNRPADTQTLCANCHSETHRKKARPMKREREQNPPTLANPSLSAVSILTPPALSRSQQHAYRLAQSTNHVAKLPVDPDALRLGFALYSMDLGGRGLRDALWPRQVPSGSSSQEKGHPSDSFLSRVIDGATGIFLLWLGVKLVKL